MNRFKRPLLASGAVVALTFSLAACGGGAPADASEDDFCKVTNDTSWFTDVEEGDYDGFADAVHDYAEDLEEVGTPEGIPDDAREGFEIQIDAAKDVDADDLKKAFESESGDDPFEAELSEDEQDKVTAFNEYQSETCGDAELPSDVPTE